MNTTTGALSPTEELDQIRWDKLHGELEGKTPALAARVAADWWAMGSKMNQDFPSLEDFSAYCEAMASEHRRRASEIRNEVLLEGLVASIKKHSHEQHNDSVDALAAAYWAKHDSIRGEFQSYEAFRAWSRGQKQSRR